MTLENPFVSVVIPVYNDAERLEKTLSALDAQTYPDDQYEVIVVDNGSTDETPSVIESFDVEAYRVTDVQSPYAARNVGIEHSGGDIIALLDATCAPVETWIEAGIDRLDEADADIVAGDIVFELGEDPSPAELYDSIAHVQVEQNARERGVATTGNLIVKRELFDEDKIGTFPIVRSSADIEWTGKATDAGYTLVYGPKAVTTYPPKDFRGLLRKTFRVGKGKPKTWARKGSHPILAAITGVVNFPAKVIRTISSSSPDDEGADSGESLPKSAIIVGAIAFAAQLLGSFVAITGYLFGTWDGETENENGGNADR